MVTFTRSPYKSLSKELREIITNPDKTKDELITELMKLKYPSIVKKGAIYYWNKFRES